MTTIVTRSGKGSALTITELDANFTNLNGDKVEATRVVGTTSGELVGGGSLNADRTLGLADSGVSAGTINNSATQHTPITIDSKGRITNTGTPVVIAPAFSSISSKPTTLSGYGITDAQGAISGAASTITSANLTASKALASDSTGKVVVSGTSSTELGFLSGVTSAVQNQLDGKQGTSGKDQANGYAGLNASGKLSDAVIPDLAVVQYLGTAANQAAMLALKDPADGVSAPQSGDWCIRSDDSKVYVVTGSSATAGGWTALGYPTAPVLSVNGYTGTVSLTKSDVQLSNVSNDAQLKIASNLSDLNNAGTARTNLGVAIGTNVQAWDADLDAIAALSGTSGFAKKTATNTWALDTSTYLTGNQSISVTGAATGSGTTAIALTLADSGATAGTYRSVTVTGKGLVTGGTNPTTFSGYGISDTSANLAAALTDKTGTGANVFATSPTLVTPILGTPQSGTLTSCTGLPLTTGVTGTLPVANGGTGLTAVGTTGNVLTSNGTTWVSSAPSGGVSTGKAIAMAMIFGY
jgi:phage-related tail fiber protein